jgi:hypothetical protein
MVSLLSERFRKMPNPPGAGKYRRCASLLVTAAFLMVAAFFFNHTPYLGHFSKSSNQ